jgi:hypothetical protein
VLYDCPLVPHPCYTLTSPRGVNYTSERNEDFYQISVEVKGMGTLQRSLDDYVKVTKKARHTHKQYHCRHCVT